MSMTEDKSDRRWLGDVPSPCVGICELDAEAGWCKGCFRTVPEIASWPRLDPAERRRLVEQLDQRRAKFAQVS
jgi:hypothetical protein